MFQFQQGLCMFQSMPPRVLRSGLEKVSRLLSLTGKVMCLALALALFGAATVGAQVSDMQPVATLTLYKTEAISVKQLRARIESLEKMSQHTLTRDERRQALDMMVDELLILQAANKDKLYVSDGEVNQELDRMRAGMNEQAKRQISDAEFAQAIKQMTNSDLTNFRTELKKQLIVHKYILNKKGDELKAVKPATDADIKIRYSDLRQSQRGMAMLTQEETLHFSAIVFLYSTDKERAKAQQAANKLSAEIGGSVTKFDEKSGIKSRDYRSADNGVIQKNAQTRDKVGAAFYNAIFALPYDQKSGATQISKPLEITQGDQRGFYIVKITAKYPFKSPLGLDDTVVELGGTVRQLLGQQIMQQRQQDATEKAIKDVIAPLRKTATVKIIDKNLDF
jgi:hypothetical protein